MQQRWRSAGFAVPLTSILSLAICDVEIGSLLLGHVCSNKSVHIEVYHLEIVRVKVSIGLFIL
jgi:hypothetical protein